MRLATLAWKNLCVEWRRALNVGSFLFFAGFFMALFTCFIGSVKTNMETAVINALAGEVRLQPAGMEKEDLFSLSGSWEEINYLTEAEMERAEKALRERINPVEVVKRVRHNVLFISDTEEVGGMILGIDPKAVSYRKALTLTAGRYLENDYEVILTETQAKNLEVQVGDTLGVLAQTKEGYTVDSALTVVGIGSVDLLNLFGYNVAYTDLRSAQELLGLTEREATDVIIYTGDKKRALETKQQLAAYFSENGLPGPTPALTTWEQTGGFIMGGINFLSILFYYFTAVLLFIISILLINIISMTVLERRRENGTLRAIGFGRMKVAWLFLQEIQLLVGFFGLLGIVAGSGVVLSLGRKPIEFGLPISYLTGRHFVFHYDPVRVFAVFCILYGVTLVVAFFPVYRATKVQPVELLKEEK